MPQFPLNAASPDLIAVMSAMSEGIVIQDRSGRIIEANPAAEEILGLSRDALLGRCSIDPRWRAVREDGADYPGAQHPAMVALQSGMAVRNQIMGVDAPERGRRWIRINASPVFDGGEPAPCRVVCTFVDITAQRELERRLANSVDELGDLYDNAPCGYHMLDAQGRYARINQTELNWLGCTREEAIGKLSPHDFLTAEGRAIFRQNFPKVLSGQDVSGLEVELLCRDGTIRRVSIHASVVKDETGRFLHTRSVLHDITKLHQAHALLERVTADQSAILNNDLIAMLKVVNRHFVWVNPGMTRLFGYTQQELINQPTRMLYLNEEDYESFGERILAQRTEGAYARSQTRLRCKDGRVIWVDVSAALLSAEQGETLGLMADITDMKMAEEARVKAFRLEAENQRIRELLRERDELLDVLAHEVRQPLNNASAALQAATSVLESQAQPQPEHQPAASAVTRARQVIHEVQCNLDNTLSVAALLVARGRVQREDTDIDMLLKLVIADMDPAHARRVRVARCTETRTASMDIGLMRLGLRNLLSNALRYSPSASEVVVRVSDSDEPLALLFDVIDAGHGIDPALMASLQDHEAHLPRGLKGRRTGLGLYIVSRVMALHGGSVELLHSGPHGTALRLVVPQGLED